MFLAWLARSARSSYIAYELRPSKRSPEAKNVGTPRDISMNVDGASGVSADGCASKKALLPGGQPLSALRG
jgi:hypothetical protein